MKPMKSRTSTFKRPFGTAIPRTSPSFSKPNLMSAGGTFRTSRNTTCQRLSIEYLDPISWTSGRPIGTTLPHSKICQPADE